MTYVLVLYVAASFTIGCKAWENAHESGCSGWGCFLVAVFMGTLWPSVVVVVSMAVSHYLEL